MIKRLLILFTAMTALVCGATACHTVHGAGEDIQSTGESIQRHSD
jgi:predicted small secreted protein